MKIIKKTAGILVLGFLLVAAAEVPGHGQAQVTHPALEERLQALAADDEIAVIVTFADQVDLEQVVKQDKQLAKDKKKLRAAILNALKSKAHQSQEKIKAFLKLKKAKKIKPYWIFNGATFTAPPGVIKELAGWPEIESIRLDDTLRVPKSGPTAAAPPEWNLGAIGAPDLWDSGITGAGVVIAGLDGGVDVNHADLAARWRGGANSWFDPNGEHAQPYDADGHGTQTMGIMVGGDASGTAIGVAPGARWIAVKIFDDAGVAAYSSIHAGFQWLLDPDGNPDSDDSPDIVNNSWGLRDYFNECSTEFQTDIQVLKAAQIAVVFAAGNEGPYSASSISPANYPESLAVGSVDDNLTVAATSSRGPCACDGNLFPDVMAPGVNVKTADLTFGGIFPQAATTASGTSFSAPHVAGAMALLLDAYPQTAVATLEQALKDSALDLGPEGADNDHGHGMIDVYAAYLQLAGAGGAPAAADDAYAVVAGSTLSIALPGVLANDSDPDGDALIAILDRDVSGGVLGLNPDGSFTYVPAPGILSDSFVYHAQDPAMQSSNTATVTISVSAPSNSAPVPVDDAATTRKNKAVFIELTANDTDAENNLKDPSGNVAAERIHIVGQPSAGGTVAVVTNGVNYNPRRNFKGSETFSYTVTDSGTPPLTSNAATVQVTVTK